MDKNYILDEIKRTAKANGGTPLGRERFYKETGINESDWLGKHWARWNDAIRESGHQPNQMQGALDENDLLEKFIDLMRELRKFPTVNEIKLKARSTTGFPWATTFARLGSKQQIAQRVRAYGARHGGYDDVVALCDEIARTPPAATDEEHGPADTFGFVYLIKSGRYYKIGRSNAAGRREHELAIQLPEKVTAVHSTRTDDPVGIEAYWHTRFKESRKNGEWFALTSDEIKAFKRRKFM